MERLTKCDNDGQAMMDCQKCEADWTGKHGKPMADCTALYCRNRLKDRLAAYENTGLTPKEVKRMSNILMDVGIDYNCSWEYVKNWLLDDRLRELAEADKDGRVAVLPVGTGGAMLDTSYPENPRLIKRVHFAVAYVSEGIVFHQPYNIFRENIAAGYISPLSEEAEKALEAMKDE